jgi:hypothetical protein
LQAVRQAKEREKEKERRKENLEKERAAAASTDRLREIQFVAPNFPGPSAARSSAQITEAEREMWEDYELNGAKFSAGDTIEKPEMRAEQLRKEAEIFGLWNPEATSNKLGFGPENTVVDEQDDDWLAEIIRNIGESVVAVRWRSSLGARSSFRSHDGCDPARNWARPF